jgi:hypothetical protein
MRTEPLAQVPFPRATPFVNAAAAAAPRAPSRRGILALAVVLGTLLVAAACGAVAYLVSGSPQVRVAAASSSALPPALPSPALTATVAPALRENTLAEPSASHAHTISPAHEKLAPRPTPSAALTSDGSAAPAPAPAPTPSAEPAPAPTPSAATPPAPDAGARGHVPRGRVHKPHG